MTEPISPRPLRDYRPAFLPAYLGNGLVGLRVGRIPFLVGSAIVNGFAGNDPNDGVEGFTRAPYPLAGDVELDGVRASAAPELVRFIEQRYDFGSGELATTLRFEVHGIAADLEILSFCSRSLPSVVLQQVSLRTNSDVDLALVAGIDPTEAWGNRRAVMQPPRPEPTSGVDGVLEWESLGAQSSLGMAYSTIFDGETDPERMTSASDQRGLIATTYRFRALAGRTYRLRTFVGFVPSLAHHSPAGQAGRVVALASRAGTSFSTRVAAPGRRSGGAGSRSTRTIAAGRRWQTPPSSIS